MPKIENFALNAKTEKMVTDIKIEKSGSECQN